MNDLKENDCSDSDSFMPQIKPVNKRKLKEHNIKQSVQSQKQKKVIGKLNTELNQIDKIQNSAGIGKCNEEFFKSIKINQENKNNHFSAGFSGDDLEINCQQKKSGGIKRPLNGKQLLFSKKSKNEEPEYIIAEIIPSSSTAKTKKFNTIENQTNGEHNFKNKVDLIPPALFLSRKKFKNDNITSRSLKRNEFVKKQFIEKSVKVQEGNCSLIQQTKYEDILSIIYDDVKNEINEIDKNKNSSSQDEEQFKGNSKVLCVLLQKIISDEMQKQKEIEENICKKGKIVEKLLSDSEFEIFKRFFNLEDNACKLFVRMLLRKNDWHRISTITYNDIGENLDKYFNILEKVNLIDVNIENEELSTQLNLLKKQEVLKLCKVFNVCSKYHNANKKDILIKLLIQECKKQKSVLDIMKGKNSNSRVELLKSQIKRHLGICMKINQRAFEAFYKIIFLFSFTHYFDEEEKRLSSTLFTCFKVYKNIIKFPNYEVSPSVIFETRMDFEEYKASLMLLSTFEGAVSHKNHDEFIAVVTEAKDGFKNVLNNLEYQKRFLGLPSFLKKFSAGTIYARILTRYCQLFKRKANNSDIVETIKLLLHQHLFLQRKRGDWYDILSKTLVNQKENNAAAEVIVMSLKDPIINEIQRLTLQLRGQGIIRKKNSGITDEKLKELLGEVCMVSVEEPAYTEIKGRVLDGNESGFKCVYIQDTEHGRKYASVEETAILYYKSHGFPKGYHVEGSLIHSIYFVMFFDIIYGLSPEGVFQSPYQDAPLDFNSTSFYLNRKEEIDKLLTDMCSWDEFKVETVIKDVYSRNYNTTCIVDWNNDFTPDLFCEVIQCITMPILVRIFQRLIQNFRVYRSGFPDLTLWNSETKEIKFVEVKSPNDRLSPAQRIWLNYLRFIGLNSEVCNVKHS